jgi:hypothetical protein
MTITKQVKSVSPFKVGAVVELTGKVTKRVRREGECKLVIEPGDVPGFVAFADFTSDADTVRNSKIRKGSPVSVRGKFQSYGAAAVCLSDCQIVEKCSDSRVYVRTENPKKT